MERSQEFTYQRCLLDGNIQQVQLCLVSRTIEDTQGSLLKPPKVGVVFWKRPHPFDTSVHVHSQGLLIMFQLRTFLFASGCPSAALLVASDPLPQGLFLLAYFVGGVIDRIPIQEEACEVLP
jgi:hypothetical protein